MSSNSPMKDGKKEEGNETRKEVKEGVDDY